MKKTVFILDDSLTNLTKAEQILSPRYNVLALETAAQMFEMLDKTVPNLILLDIEMPEMDGFEVFAKLEANEDWKDIPVVYFTAHTKEEYISQCLETGACDIVIKPYDDETILNTVRTHIA